MMDHGVLATHYYTLLVIKSLQNFQKMFWDGYTTYFRKKKIFLFFRKISNNVLRKLDEKPKLHGYILPR